MRRFVLLAVAGLVLLAAVSWSAFQPSQPRPLAWLEKSKPVPGAAEMAVLVELGVQDRKAQDWSGEFAIRGGKVVRKTSVGFRGQDRWTGPQAWNAGTHQLRRWWRNAGPTPILPVGFVVHVDGDAPVLTVSTPQGKAELKVPELRDQPHVTKLDGQIRFSRVSHTVPLADKETEDDFPAACIGPDGSVHAVYVSYTLSEPRRREPLASVTRDPENFDAYAAPVLGDRLWLRTLAAGEWSAPVPITSPRQDLCRIAVAAAGDGSVWIAYSAQRNGNFDLFLRAVKAGQVQPVLRLTEHPLPDINPVMATDGQGRPWVAWQGFRSGQAKIFAAHLQDDGTWTKAEPLSDDAGNAWHPAVAASGDGTVAVAWDQYRDGDYDTLVRQWRGQQGWRPQKIVAGSDRFEAKPALSYDLEGRLFIAYEDGPPRWGKDYGALDQGEGRGLYHGHQIKVCVLDGEKLLAPKAALPRAQPNEENRRLDGPQYSHPQIALDKDGSVWLSYRQAFGTRYHTAVGAYWMSFVHRLEGDAWSDPVLLHRSDAKLDRRPALLPHPQGGVLAVYSGDSRYQNPDEVGNNVYFGQLTGLAEEAAPPVLEPAGPGRKDPVQDDAEQADVAAIRKYRIRAGGKERQLLRGEFHRHTEISWDGRPDGSITDMFRYGLDAAAFDWIGNGDHDHGGGREYPWWLTQKYNDAYQAEPHFLPMFTYERSNGYPHGHRNAMFAKRGIRTLPRLRDDRGRLSENDTKMFYRYLKQFGGICASHTSATGMGTDWRDNDPVAEPIVEIYQGDRNSYEYPGAPRSGTEGTNLGGWRPKGFVNLALEKGIKFGFQASSDHWSTHISYCIVAAEEPTREAIVAALKQRHCYGATDNIILDVQSSDGKWMMGDSYETARKPEFKIYARGTGPIDRIDILRDSQVIDTVAGEGREMKLTWSDAQPQEGEHYYYARVLQKNAEIAWGTPLWVKCKPGN